jgi:hypothetical protein
MYLLFRGLFDFSGLIARQITEITSISQKKQIMIC